MIFIASKPIRLSVTIGAVLMLMSFVFSNKVSISAHDNPFQYQVSLPTAKEPILADAEHDFIQEGEASWYGEEFHNRPTASGETYNMNDLTAAHKTLPFGTLAIVTNKVTGRSIVVKINDRGPFVSKRIIDLSKRAASTLGGSLYKIQIEAFTPGSFSTEKEEGKVLVFTEEGEAQLVSHSLLRDLETYSNFGSAVSRLAKLSKENVSVQYTIKPTWVSNGTKDVIRYVINTVSTEQPEMPVLF